MTPPRFQFVIIRCNMLAEVYAARLLIKYGIVSEVIQTGQLTELPQCTLNAISGNNTLILGGYYRKSIGIIRNAVGISAELMVICNDSNPHEWAIQGTPCASAIRMIYSFIRKEDESKEQSELDLNSIIPGINEAEHIIANRFDDYLEGSYTEECLNLKCAVYNLPGCNLWEQCRYLLSNCNNLQDLQGLIQSGQKLQEPIMRQAKSIAETGNYLYFNGLEIYYACAPTPIAEATMVLARKSKDGIGLLIRYNYNPLDKDENPNTKQTFISIFSSGKHRADEIANKIVGGVGNAHTAGGGVADVLTPEQLFKVDGINICIGTAENPTGIPKALPSSSPVAEQ
jgi:hypothetical protein